MVYSIFVEGDADKRLLEQLLDYLNLSDDQGKVIKTNGYTNLLAEKTEQTYLNQMLHTSADGGVNLVIFDADTDFKQRESEILGWKEKHQVEFELFLFPNNEEEGELEDLLERMINPENQPVIDCWTSFEDSLKVIDLPWKKGEALTIPAKKTKIYAYLEVLLGTSRSEKDKIKEKNRDYRNADHWNLDAPALAGLVDFLQRFLDN